jgi:rhodanese-related sulfurtransferase
MKMIKKLSMSLFILTFLIILILAQKEENHEKSIVSVYEVKEKIQNKENIVLLDVRTKGEFEGNIGHIDGSILIPLKDIEDRLKELTEYKEKEIITICARGFRSQIAADILIKNGFNAFNMAGGLIAYRKMEKEFEHNDSESESDKNHQ